MPYNIDELSLSDISQDDVDNAAEIIINVIKSDDKYTTLDLNKGTVLYELLIRPMSELWALESLRSNTIQTYKSLYTLAQSGETPPAQFVNDLLSNFGLQVATGTKATGEIKITVSKDQSYTIPEGTVFTNSTELEYVTTRQYVAARNPTGEQIQLLDGANGTFYFIITIEASDYGTNYILNQGDRLNSSIIISNNTSIEAYANFNGGIASDDLETVIESLPASIAHIGLESRTSIEHILTSPDYGNFTDLQDISILGAGDPGQIRDKHNIGISTFGHVDVLPKMFVRPQITTLEKTGVRVSPGVFEITIDQEDAPGYYAVKSVTEAESVIAPTFAFGSLQAIGSYLFEDVRSHISLADIPHDISSINSVIETAYTKYQTSKILVYNVLTPPTDEHPFKVELYTSPYLSDIQDFINNSQITNVASDYLVRMPLICLVGIKATIHASATSDVTEDELKEILLDYVNARNFKPRLTQSEIVGALYAADIDYIDLSSDTETGFQMRGQIRGANGSISSLNGPDLVIADVEDVNALIAKETCVFGSEATNISITLRKA